jgi:HEAT repeat protein
MILLDQNAPMPQRIAAARALGKSRDPEAVPALLKAIGSRNEELADAVLASLRQQEAVPRLLAILEDAAAARDLQVLAARGLRILKDPRSIPAMINALRSPTVEVRKEACLGLGRFKAPESLEPLIEAMSNDADSTIRYLAAETVGEMRSPRAKAALAERVKVERDAVVKSAISEGLRNQE